MSRLWAEFTMAGFCAVLIWNAAGCSRAPSPDALPYRRHANVPYGDADRPELTMDVFVPTSGARGLAVIDVASAGLYSDRGKVEVHREAGMFDILCRRGLTVFAVRPGSAPQYAIPEQLEHVRRAIRFVRCRAGDYGIDPERIGITGGGAGGHLACLAAVTSDDGDPNAADKLARYGTRVRTAGIFFAPTALDDWKADEAHAIRPGFLLFPDGAQNKNTTEIMNRLRAISPREHVRPGAPSFLFIHGEADPYVPVEQSLKMAETVRAAGGKARVIVKKDAKHTWPTIEEEIETLARWFERELSAEK